MDYNFNLVATRPLTLDVNRYIEERGIRVVTFVSDMGPENVSARRELGITVEHFTFTYPSLLN